MMQRVKRQSRREPTIALINVVFLMLVFFLVAGSFAPPLDPDLTLVKTQDLDTTQPPQALVINAEGELSYEGSSIESVLSVAQNFQDKPIRIIPDQDLSANTLIARARELRAAGVPRVIIVTEEALP